MTEEVLICTVAIELSRSRWVIGALPPRGAKVTVGAIAGGDTDRLMEHFNKIETRLRREYEERVELKICFEAGYDGFWLARFLRDRGLDVYVLDASSFLISRRGRRTKTDRIDVEAMTFTLRAYLAGDPSVCRVVPIPTPEVEDAKRISRERTRLASERTRHVNRIRGLLSLHGIRSIKGLWGGGWRDQLDTVETGDGRSLGRYIKAEITREFERLHLVLDQIKALEAERRDTLLDPASAFPDRPKVALLTKLAGIGELSATLLVAEVFHRQSQADGISPPISALLQPLTPAAMSSVIRASARPVTSRRGPCSSRSPGLGCATSPRVSLPLGTGRASPTMAHEAAKSALSQC